jgi:hypothetical protein
LFKIASRVFHCDISMYISIITKIGSSPLFFSTSTCNTFTKIDHILAYKTSSKKLIFKTYKFSLTQ